jgi:hypothetical protein
MSPYLKHIILYHKNTVQWAGVTPWMTGQRGSRHRAGGDEGGVVGVVQDRGQSSPGWTIAYDG